MRSIPTVPTGARRVVAAGVALVALAASFVPWNATVGVTANAAAITTQNWKLGRGVKLTRIRYPETPNEVRILTLIPQRGPTLDPVAADPEFPMYELSSRMASDNGAIAGTNGDFATDYGAPVHAFMVDGELWKSGESGAMYGITPDGTRAFIGRPNLRMIARAHATTQKIEHWNAGSPEVNTVHAYTHRGGTAIQPPGVANPTASDPMWCAVRLGASTPYHWASSKHTMIERGYTVQQQECAKTRMSLGSDPDTVVLASKGTDGSGSTWLKTLNGGDSVELQYGFPEWPGATDVGGGNDMLVNRGENVAPAHYPGAPNILWYNPRTAVGVNAGCGDTVPGTTCKIFVVTVDGRQSSTGWSKGMQLPRLAKELLDLGARFAVNLDGGASTVMWVKRRNDAYCQHANSFGGCLVDRPSASFGERVTITGLSILSTADPNTPAGLT